MRYGAAIARSGSGPRPNWPQARLAPNHSLALSGSGLWVLDCVRCRVRVVNPARLPELCEKLLANPLIEDFEIQPLDTPSPPPPPPQGAQPRRRRD